MVQWFSWKEVHLWSEKLRKRHSERPAVSEEVFDRAPVKRGTHWVLISAYDMSTLIWNFVNFCKCRHQTRVIMNSITFLFWIFKIKECFVDTLYIDSKKEGSDNVMGNTCNLSSQLTSVGLRSSLRAPKRLSCTLGSTSVQTPLALNGLEPP